MNLNYKNLHSPITKSETNAIYYLLRTLGRLKETVTLQKNAVVNGEYGDYLLGENTITVSNVEPIATYDVTYTIYNYIDETSRTVEISVDTEEEPEITIPLPTLSQNEELKRLLIHGTLHLNGYDHGEAHIEPGVEPDDEMLKLQETVLSGFSDITIIE